MRNLKKILALVLALVMVIGMMSIASAATPGTGYADDADITKFDESIQILTALGIYKGDGEGEFEPNDPITRAEVAALVYRIVHDEKYVGIYADYNKFDDVNSKDWFAGYVNYCANGEFIVGDGRGNFNPDDYVDGYQVLAIVLRAIGYDREGEFQGAGWEVRTARKAKELGITKNIVDGTLGAPATRAMVAELIYRAIAQTSTVSWKLLESYKANNVTLAYENFGLQGQLGISPEGGYDADDYKLMTVREDAVPDTLYGEPVAYWYIPDADGSDVKDADGSADTDRISIRFNPVKTYTGVASEHTVYVDSGKGSYVLGSTVTVDHNYVDGRNYEGGVTSVTYKETDPVANTGNGVVTDLYVVPQIEGGSEVYLIVKNTYIDQVEKSTAVEFKLLSPDYQALSNPYYTSTIGAGNMVLFNMYNDKVDVATLHVSKFAPVTVSATYDNGDFNTSYFKAGNTKYSYNANYHEFELAATTFGWAFNPAETTDIMNGKKYERNDKGELLNTSNFGLGDPANVFYDDFGNVILLGAISTVSAKGVGVVIGADTLRVGLGKYVVEMDVIGTDGAKKTVKAVIGDIDSWTYDEQAADEAVQGLMAEIDTLATGAKLVGWTVDAETGYYVVNSIATELDTDIVRGDANSTSVNVDNTTVYIVETYKNDGKDIKGYTTYTGFKSVPSLTDLTDYEIQYVKDPNTSATVLFVKGATKAEQPESVTVPELVYVMDDVPEKNLTKDEDGNTVTYWVYTVVKNGQVTTLKSTTDPVGLLYTGLYEIEKDTETRNMYKLVPMDTQQAILAGDPATKYYAAVNGVLYTSETKYEDDRFDLGTKLTLADSVKVYVISGTTLTESELADLTVGMSIEFLVDKYGYVSTIFVIDAKNPFANTLDGEGHKQ